MWHSNQNADKIVEIKMSGKTNKTISASSVMFHTHTHTDRSILRKKRVHLIEVCCEEVPCDHNWKIRCFQLSVSQKHFAKSTKHHNSS